MLPMAAAVLHPVHGNPPYQEGYDTSGGIKCYVCRANVGTMWSQVATHLKNCHGVLSRHIAGSYLHKMARAEERVKEKALYHNGPKVKKPKAKKGAGGSSTGGVTGVPVDPGAGGVVWKPVLCWVAHTPDGSMVEPFRTKGPVCSTPNPNQQGSALVQCAVQGSELDTPNILEAQDPGPAEAVPLLQPPEDAGGRAGHLEQIAKEMEDPDDQKSMADVGVKQRPGRRKAPPQCPAEPPELHKRRRFWGGRAKPLPPPEGAIKVEPNFDA